MLYMFFSIISLAIYFFQFLQRNLQQIVQIKVTIYALTTYWHLITNMIKNTGNIYLSWIENKGNEKIKDGASL